MSVTITPSDVPPYPWGRVIPPLCLPDQGLEEPPNRLLLTLSPRRDGKVVGLLYLTGG